MQRRTFLKSSLFATGLATLGTGALTPLRGQLGGQGAGGAPKAPFLSRPNLDRTRGFPGALMHFLVRSDETGGDFGLIEARARPGIEPPPHIHLNEDESVYLMSGEMWFRVGDQEFEARSGDFMFMPKGIEHEFKILSDEIHVALQFSPGGLDEYFWRLSQPLASVEIPPPSTAPPTPEQIEMMHAINAEFGIVHAAPSAG